VNLELKNQITKLRKKKKLSEKDHWQNREKEEIENRTINK
jgi:hypothetical protein